MCYNKVTGQGVRDTRHRPDDMGFRKPGAGGLILFSDGYQGLAGLTLERDPLFSFKKVPSGCTRSTDSRRAQSGRRELSQEPL